MDMIPAAPKAGISGAERPQGAAEARAALAEPRHEAERVARAGDPVPALPSTVTRNPGVADDTQARLSALSHALRSPLNSLLAWAQVLQRQPSPELVVRAAEAIERNVALQVRLLTEALDRPADREPPA